MIKLYQAQQKQVDKAQPNWFYRMKQGTGKTPTAIAHYKKFFNGKKVLVVAPKAVELSGSWQETFEEMGVDKSLVKVIRTDDVKKVDLQDVKGAFVIVDEAHKFKGMGSQRTKALHKIIKVSDGFIMLTGTPVDGKLDNLESYAIAFSHVKTRKQFKELYMVQKTLPYRPFPFWEVGKNKDKLVSWFEIITSDVVTIDDIAELPEYIENVVHFKRESESLKETFKGAGEINGKSHTNHHKGVLLVQIQAGGAGLTLNEYKHVIWYSLPYSYTDFDQSKYRNYRIGQDTKVTRDYLVVDGTIDDKIIEALNNKIDFNAKLEK